MNESGMEMLLSAIASPIEDDWQLGQTLIKNEVLDSAAQSPSSSLFDDFDDSSSSSLSSPSFACDSGNSSLSSYDMTFNGFPDVSALVCKEEIPEISMKKKKIVVRRRIRECSMVCWLFRTLLTSEYRALPVNAIYEIFEETLQNQSIGHGRHYRQSIRHCLMTSAVFVRVLTPNPRKDFLVMNEQGSWWTVHPDCEQACVEQVFKSGSSHRCPPNASIPAYYSRIREDDARTSNVGATKSKNMAGSSYNTECSNSTTSSLTRRYDPIRRVGFGQTSKPSTTYRRYTTGISQAKSAGQQSQNLINPRSILLNDIAIDHEEVV